MTRRAVEPAAIAAAGALCALGVLVLDPGPLRWTLGATLVLVLPGAALSLLPGRAVSGADRLLAVLAAGVATAILTGVALGASHAGFAASSWALALGAITVAAALASLLRHEAAPGAEERPRYACARASLRRCAPSLACFAVAGAVAVLAVVLARHSASRNGERATRIVNLVPAQTRERAR